MNVDISSVVPLVEHQTNAASELLCAVQAGKRGSPLYCYNNNNNKETCKEQEGVCYKSLPNCIMAGSDLTAVRQAAGDDQRHDWSCRTTLSQSGVETVNLIR